MFRMHCMSLKRAGFLSILILAHLTQGWANKDRSVLAEGEWHKIAVMEDGVYKIDASFLSELGINSADVDPSKIALFGNGYNGMLPQANRSERPDDLIENALIGHGLEDGSFDADDYLLFYGHSAHGTFFDSSSGEFSFEKNSYSDTSFYFITIKSENALRASQGQNSTSGTNAKDTYLHFHPHEQDLYNMIESGRVWVGERMTTSSRSNSVSFESIRPVAGTDIVLDIRVAAHKDEDGSFFSLNANDLSLGDIQMVSVPEADYHIEVNYQVRSYNIDDNAVVDNNVNLGLLYTHNGASATGYVDYAHLTVTEKLDLTHGPISLNRTDGDQSYSISGANTTSQVWDVSDPTRPILQNHSVSDGKAIFDIVGNESQFVAFNEGQEMRPQYMQKIKNQNLHGLGRAEVIYITHKKFETEAVRLAEFRASHDDMLTQVVTVDQIYNEYSSGRQDITAIRDFIRHQYIKHDTTLRYVTLFGDCSYDYKDRLVFHTNYVPVYEARNSEHPIKSYSSEDYYGFLEEEEGMWYENHTGNQTVEIGIGRIPVREVDEAADYVDKIMRYQEGHQRFGKWRNKITFIADDEDGNQHQTNADDLARILSTTQSVFNIEKVFLDSYEQIKLPDGEESPGASEAFVEAVSSGNLVVNYTGHGNERRLTHESIFTVDMITDLSNRTLMPFFVAATCDFGNYDNPIMISGGEQMLLHPQGGSIALLCSTRPVISGSNFELNVAFYNSFVTKEDGKFKRLGDLIRETKNNSFDGTRNRNYALLGDASMRLSFPEKAVELVRINDQEINMGVDTLRALGQYKIEGRILADSTTDDQFNGTVHVSVYDKPTHFKTLGFGSNPEIYEIQDVLLFQGESTVTNGQFTSEFIVPKNINYSFAEGKMTFYAVDDASSIDAHGSFTDAVVGGSNSDYERDNIPPEIEMYFDDEDFESSRTIGSDALFIAQLTDQSGINISNLGYENDLILILDNEVEYMVNDYYTATLDSYQSGTVAFPMENLEPGHHEVRLVAYDVHNNRAEEVMEFFVESGNKLELYEVMAYPNPITDDRNTTFRITHDRPGEELDAILTITNLHGEVIIRSYYRFVGSFENTTQNFSSGYSNEIAWNGRDAWGNRLNKGTYIYKILIQSRVDGAKSAKYHKLVVLN